MALNTDDIINAIDTLDDIFIDVILQAVCKKRKKAVVDAVALHGVLHALLVDEPHVLRELLHVYALEERLGVNGDNMTKLRRVVRDYNHSVGGDNNGK